MKSYKDVKARFKVGMELEATNHVRPESSSRREVMKVQTNGYWFERRPVHTHQSRFWFAFPAKAADCRIDGPDQVTFLDEGVPLVTIRFLP